MLHGMYPKHVLEPLSSTSPHTTYKHEHKYIFMNYPHVIKGTSK